jgi:hypothetical protein
MCLVVLAIIAAFSFLISWLLMVLWNVVVPTLFHGPHITYWIAYAFYWLSVIITGGFKINTSSK